MNNERPELSEKNPYWIPKHKYYELKHFCLQYQDWVNQLEELSDGYTPVKGYGIAKGTYYSNPVLKTLMYRETLEEKIKIVEDTRQEASKELSTYILRSVTEELPYNYLRYRLNIPCGKDMFYERRRRFFWLLRQKK